MYDTTQILSKHGRLTASSDEFGLYGSVFAPDSDYEVPQPPNLYNEPYYKEPSHRLDKTEDSKVI